MAKQDENQGEGNRTAAKRYNTLTRKFVKSGKVEDAARRAGKGNEKEMQDAETKTRSRAREHDPNVDRDYTKPTKHR